VIAEYSMSKKIVFTVFFCLLLFMPPMTVAMTISQKSVAKTMMSDWTYLQGIITRPRHEEINGYDYVTFNAIFVHYTTHWFGNIRSGVFRHFEKIFLPAFHYGFLGRHLVFAKFNIGLVPYTA